MPRVLQVAPLVGRARPALVGPIMGAAVPAASAGAVAILAASRRGATDGRDMGGARR